MKIAHISDTHLGYKQFGLVDRENDFLEVFNQAVTKIIELAPDFVLHTGDMFEQSRPPTSALLAAQAELRRLQSAGIKLYSIPGNHDMILRRGALPPQVLFKDLGVNLISPKNPFYVHDGIFIGGSPYVSKYHQNQLTETLEFLDEESGDYDKNILMLHQGLDKYLPVDFELSVSQLPEGFDYYAMGHIHDRIIDTFNGVPLSYAGSTEMWRFNELPDYLKHGKGFNLVELREGRTVIEHVNLNLPRELIEKKIQISNLDEVLDELRDHISTLTKPPLAIITVKGGNMDRADVYEKVNTALSEFCLSLRTSYKPTQDVRGGVTVGEDAIAIDRLIRQHLEPFHDEKICELGVDLAKELSDGDIQVAAAMVDDFFTGELVS